MKQPIPTHRNNTIKQILTDLLNILESMIGPLCFYYSQLNPLGGLVEQLTRNFPVARRSPRSPEGINQHEDFSFFRKDFLRYNFLDIFLVLDAT